MQTNSDKAITLGDLVYFIPKHIYEKNQEYPPSFGYVVNVDRELKLYSGGKYYDFEDIQITEVQHSCVYNVIVGDKPEQAPGVLTTNIATYNTPCYEDLQKAVIESNMKAEDKLALIRILEERAYTPIQWPISDLPNPAQPSIWYNYEQRRIETTPKCNPNEVTC